MSVLCQVRAILGFAVALIVAADGSARRGLKAPGYIDPRAADYDAQLAWCLSSGDAAGLADLDRHLAAELLSRGTTSLQRLQSLAAELESAYTRWDALESQEPV